MKLFSGFSEALFFGYCEKVAEYSEIHIEIPFLSRMIFSNREDAEQFRFLGGRNWESTEQFR